MNPIYRSGDRKKRDGETDIAREIDYFPLAVVKHR